jgi:hypothetical protein
VGAIQAQNEAETCQDVVAWLKAACTARGSGGAQNATPSVVHAFPPLHLPPEAYRYVTSKVQADLPALDGGLGGGSGGVTDPTVAGALQALGLARALEGGGAAAGVKPPKTITEAYKETHTTLLRFCNAASSEGVAPVWLRLASCHKSEQHTVLMQELQKVCMARGLATEIYTPVITTSLKQMITGLQFAGHGIDDLTAGCQPFLVCYSGGTDYYAALAAASIGHQLAQGGTTCKPCGLQVHPRAREGKVSEGFPGGLHYFSTLLGTLSRPIPRARGEASFRGSDVVGDSGDPFSNPLCSGPIASTGSTRPSHLTNVPRPDCEGGASGGTGAPAASGRQYFG